MSTWRVWSNQLGCSGLMACVRGLLRVWEQSQYLGELTFYQFFPRCFICKISISGDNWRTKPCHRCWTRRSQVTKLTTLPPHFCLFYRSSGTFTFSLYLQKFEPHAHSYICARHHSYFTVAFTNMISSPKTASSTTCKMLNLWAAMWSRSRPTATLTTLEDFITFRRWFIGISVTCLLDTLWVQVLSQLCRCGSTRRNQRV